MHDSDFYRLNRFLAEDRDPQDRIIRIGRIIMTHIEAKSINIWLRYDPKWEYPHHMSHLLSDDKGKTRMNMMKRKMKQNFKSILQNNNSLNNVIFILLTMPGDFWNNIKKTPIWRLIFSLVSIVTQHQKAGARDMY